MQAFSAIIHDCDNANFTRCMFSVDSRLFIETQTRKRGCYSSPFSSYILKRLENPQNDRGIFFCLSSRVLRSDAGIISRTERSQADKEPRSFRVFQWFEYIPKPLQDKSKLARNRCQINHVHPSASRLP